MFHLLDVISHIYDISDHSPDTEALATENKFGEYGGRIG